MNYLSKTAIKILNDNWKDGFTIPTANLYPFQWNWDSGFTCLGQSYFNLDYAIRELNSLFTGQWQNGMLPHIIFHSENEKTYFPNYDFWNSNVNSGAPVKPKTSGITQPPVHGFILEELLEKNPGNARLKDFAQNIFPKIVAAHRFLYSYRDPNREGLFFIFHPWESGRDNSPLWDNILDKIKLDKTQLPEYVRRDTSIADSSERPTSIQYDCYVYLLELGKKFQYDQPGIVAESPFLVQDTLMNAILIKSNESLIRIGKQFGMDTGEIEEWQQQSVSSFKSKLWNSKLQTYTCYDLRNETTIDYREVGALVSLYAGIPDAEKAGILNKQLTDLHDRGFYLCPSFDVDSPLFDSKRYWRGPVWPQMNWLIYKGLLRYDYDDTATIVRSDILELVNKLGFYEYFESQKELLPELTKGYGGGNFSWTSAVVLDLIHT